MKHYYRHVFFSLALMLLALPALALDLQSARAKGVLGEQADGYVAPLNSTAEVQALADEINAKRRAEYARISKENGQPVSVVGTLAAGQILGKLPPGAKYQDANGHWKKK